MLPRRLLAVALGTATIAGVFASAIAAGGQASSGGGLPYSNAPSNQVQPQPPAGSCHDKGTGMFRQPDAGCTPGARNPAVHQSTIATTICKAGYTKTIRPPERITNEEKTASMAAYGDTQPKSHYEYDHLVSLELGGAANDPRNLWPEPGGSPNPKDKLENRLHAEVCDHQIRLITAQRQIAHRWVATYHRLFG